MEKISLLLAFSAGLLSFLSPCVLPLVPAYISYLTGSSIEDRKNSKAERGTLYKSLGFVLGFSIVFILMGASVTTVGKLFITYRGVIQKLGGILIMIFGLHMTGIWKIKLFYREKRFNKPDSWKGPLSSVLMGIAFAAGWTPCIGPILSSILIYATSEDTIGKGIFLLVGYSFGLAVPFVLAAMAIGSFGKAIKKLNRFLPAASMLSGLLLIIMGFLVFTNKLAMLSRYAGFFNI